MSNASGAVMKDEKLVGFFEYSKTVDVANSAIWPTHEEMMKHWRNQPQNECVCGKPPQKVVLYTGGLYWPAEVCLRCGAIVKNASPHESKPIKGRPKGLTKKMVEEFVE